MKFVSVEFENFVADFYKSKAKSAEDRGLEWGLSIVSLRNMLRSKRCPYTGVEMTIPRSSHPRPTDLTIDRISNLKGYVPGNVMAISRASNNFKSIFENPQYPMDMATAHKALGRMQKRLNKRAVSHAAQG